MQVRGMARMDTEPMVEPLTDVFQPPTDVYDFLHAGNTRRHP